MDEPGRNAEVGDPESQSGCCSRRPAPATLEAARMLKAVCESLGWQCGAISGGSIAPETPCAALGLGVDCRSRSPTPRPRFVHHRVGLPGRVGPAAEPAGCGERDSPRPQLPASTRERAGLHSAFALPIRQGRRVGVLEFQPRHGSNRRRSCSRRCNVRLYRILASTSNGKWPENIDGSSSCRLTCSASRMLSRGPTPAWQTVSATPTRSCAHPRSWTSYTRERLGRHRGCDVHTQDWRRHP